MLSIAIVEDNERDRQELADCLSRYSADTGEKLAVKQFDSSIKFLDKYGVGYDIVFLDIKMPGLDGMAVAERLRGYDQSVYIIFVTSMAQYAIHGYSVRAYDYLLKPIKYYDIKMRLQRIKNKKKRDSHIITIPFRGGIKRFAASEIIYIESLAHNIVFHNGDGNFDYRGKSMRELENELAPYGFFRCNTSYIVNLKYCTGVSSNDVFIGDEVLPLSRDRKKAFLKALSGGDSESI